MVAYLKLASSILAAEQVATQPEIASSVSSYYWKIIKPRLNIKADKDDLFWVSVYINEWAKQKNPYCLDKPK
ncbi:hypothetical protein [Candidatus Schmidhempelia bombi]|uniref:Uncharacterized protein n=1 Tax=Candidatus Schmidhempelia bombi str. Bimp TaxID=1387197 RepID=A0AB94IAC1_9GAMM|nr:hypothetical protein [Candidatus Schmidhempelia bombi]TEA26328.1 hypothetical protein O970_09230 [Candidatus Schmidhempelia bombi str. Bimp]